VARIADMLLHPGEALHCNGRAMHYPDIRLVNPNILPHDTGTSRLAQGSTGQLTKVEVERFAGELPPVRIFEKCGFWPRLLAKKADRDCG
jgi:hypothetical protein